jgi:hypothetical protein
MSKRKKHKLIFPPRYARGDPRNMERQEIGQNLGRMIQRYNENVTPPAGEVEKGETNRA